MWTFLKGAFKLVWYAADIPQRLTVLAILGAVHMADFNVESMCIPHHNLRWKKTNTLISCRFFSAENLQIYVRKNPPCEHTLMGCTKSACFPLWKIHTDISDMSRNYAHFLCGIHTDFTKSAWNDMSLISAPIFLHNTHAFCAEIHYVNGPLL